MKGARPLTDSEISLLLTQGFVGTYSLRNTVLFLLRVKTGLRISEALSIKIVDVVSSGDIVDRLYIHRRNVKGKTEGRSIILHPEVRQQLALYLSTLPTQEYLFESRKGGMLDKRSAWRIDKVACDKVGIDPHRISTHSTRKTFAEKVHTKLGRDIIKTQKALGHKDINSTVQYLSVDGDEIDQAILDL